jgi:hypothetical protein
MKNIFCGSFALRNIQKEIKNNLFQKTKIEKEKSVTLSLISVLSGENQYNSKIIFYFLLKSVFLNENNWCNRNNYEKRREKKIELTNKHISYLISST